ncbi:MAG: TrkH family potassium uptake protein [Deferribacteraceae bacterium]|jgi:trk system potassium uptake protein TrkH|nr:TrkH family potassium uptake protein [Deferribacteraceae bacterium]
MHGFLLLRILAFVALFMSLAMLPSAAVSYFADGTEIFLRFIFCMAIVALPAGMILFFTRNIPPGGLNVKDGFIVVFMAWFCVILVATLPFTFTGILPNYSDAFFEASSGITTTGATVISGLDRVYKGVLLWRSTCIWLGGMGIVMLSVTLMPLLGIGNMQLFKAEAGGLDVERLTPRIAQTAKLLWIIYLTFTVISAILFKIFGMDLFNAVNHAMSAIASGGFSTKDDSFMYFRSSGIEWVAICTMFASGINFALYFRLFTGKFNTVFQNTEVRAYILIILSASAAVALTNLFQQGGKFFGDTVRSAVFHTMAVLTTSGFYTEDYDSWHPLSQFILLLLMLCGGCAGSTSGGFKVMRVVILFKQAINEMRTFLHPRGVFTIRLNGAPLNKSLVYGVTGFLFLYILTVFVVTGVAASSGADFYTAFSTGLAMVGNVGPGFAGAGPTETFGFYPDYVKVILGLAMIIGRLEIYTFFMLLMPFFWKK